MKIQWFPGHMNKARNEMAETLPRVDLLIELLDARIPFSSENPMLADLRGDKPCLKLLGKSDLADPAQTDRWLNYLEQEQGIRARAITTEDRQQIRQLTQVCASMVPHRQGPGKVIRAMIAGIPNVGKSTVINILAGRKVARTGNEPAITKGQQRIKLGENVLLLDTPGMLWPNVENQNSGYRLATTGAVKDTAMEYEDVAHFAAGFMVESYPERIVERYKLEENPASGLALLDEIGKKRGCLNKRGIIDYERASRIFLTELRGGKLGRVTFETPEVMQRELAELIVTREEKTLQKQQDKEKRKAKFKARQKESRHHRE